jgi:hypothetical protein
MIPLYSIYIGENPHVYIPTWRLVPPVVTRHIAMRRVEVMQEKIEEWMG